MRDWDWGGIGFGFLLILLVGSLVFLAVWFTVQDNNNKETCRNEGGTVVAAEYGEGWSCVDRKRS